MSRVVDPVLRNTDETPCISSRFSGCPTRATSCMEDANTFSMCISHADPHCSQNTHLLPHGWPKYRVRGGHRIRRRARRDIRDIRIRRKHNARWDVRRVVEECAAGTGVPGSDGRARATCGHECSRTCASHVHASVAFVLPMLAHAHKRIARCTRGCIQGTRARQEGLFSLTQHLLANRLDRMHHPSLTLHLPPLHTFYHY